MDFYTYRGFTIEFSMLSEGFPCSFLYLQLREHLISLSPVNKENLELIQSAVIGNSLVEESPLDNTQVRCDSVYLSLK